MEQLRETTRALHRRVESLPFSEAALEGRLPPTSYIGFLKGMSIVHRALESEVERSEHPALRAVWRAEMGKRELLRRDLARFAAGQVAETPRASASAVALADTIRFRAATRPSSLLGYLYVLEGSTLGGAVLRSAVARSFDPEGEGGVAYLSGYGSQTAERWRGFSERLDRIGSSLDEHEPVLDAARECFGGVERILRALYPLTEGEGLRDQVFSLNPEAGTHPIPEDLRELEAALEAGDETWRCFPYLEKRYGERGRKFTRSDSAWIVSLATSREETVLEQIEWLGDVLASRGMPRWILETHLEHLHGTLKRSVPEKRHEYEKLRSAALRLRAARLARIGEATVRSLAAEFERRTDRGWARRLPEAGELLVAAVADEKAGIRHAVSSVEVWMTEKRFPTRWVKAVEETIRKARST